jgi:hypothetical protein
MLWNLYLREGKVIVPTVAKAGGFLDIDPVTVVPADDRPGIIAAIKKAYAKGNPKQRPPSKQWHIMPSKRHFPAPVVLKPVGVKTWSAFQKNASCWNIRFQDDTFEIWPLKKDPDGEGWLGNPEKVEKLPPGTSIDEVAEKVAEQIINSASQP